jgi:hypothetical protein
VHTTLPGDTTFAGTSAALDLVVFLDVTGPVPTLLKVCPVPTLLKVCLLVMRLGSFKNEISEEFLIFAGEKNGQMQCRTSTSGLRDLFLFFFVPIGEKFVFLSRKGKNLCFFVPIGEKFVFF